MSISIIIQLDGKIKMVENTKFSFPTWIKLMNHLAFQAALEVPGSPQGGSSSRGSLQDRAGKPREPQGTGGTNGDPT